MADPGDGDDHRPTSLPLAKYLSSTDKKTRDKAVRSIAQFLSTPGQGVSSKLEMAKLWKGIFYCYWLSDKPLVQQALSSELANILLVISSIDTALAFLAGFWEATVREWNGIDRLRMDKYYMLVRKFVNATLRFYMHHGWKKSLIERGNDVLVQKGGPLCPQDNKVPSSLAFHISEVFLAELDSILKDSYDNAEILPAPLLPLLDPFMTFVARTNNRQSYNRIFQELYNPLLITLSTLSQDAETPSRKRPRLTIDMPLDNIKAHSVLEDPTKEDKVEAQTLRRAIVQRLFEVANGPDTRESNRKWMVAVWKAEMAEVIGQKATSDLDGS